MEEGGTLRSVGASYAATVPSMLPASAPLSVLPMLLILFAMLSARNGASARSIVVLAILLVVAHDLPCTCTLLLCSSFLFFPFFLEYTLLVCSAAGPDA